MQKNSTHLLEISTDNCLELWQARGNLVLCDAIPFITCSNQYDLVVKQIILTFKQQLNPPEIKSCASNAYPEQAIGQIGEY